MTPFARIVPVGLSIIAVAGASACAGRPRPLPWPSPSTPFQTSSDDVRVLVRGDVERVPVEAYVRGSVEVEAWVPSRDSAEVAVRAFELQALIARTYLDANRGRHQAEGADVCDTTHCQLYRPPTSTHPRAAQMDDGVARTVGQLVLFDGRPALTLFHASCGGATSAPETVWGGASRPYLRSADDVFCQRAPQPWRIRLARDALARALDADARTRVGGRLDAVDTLTRDAGDRVVLVGLIGALSPVVRGEELRGVLVRAFGLRSVRSARFTVTRERDAFVIEGTGFGHGAGLCQAGALARLRAGNAVVDVLSHYYPGVLVGRGRPLTLDISQGHYRDE